MSAIALLVAATLAQAGSLRSDLALRGGGARSPVVSLVAMDKGGSADWGSGIPSPTIDCAAVGSSSVASMQCSGATPSFAGPGQAAAGSPWWYRGDTAVRPAIALNGSTDYWDLGTLGGLDIGGGAGCIEIRPDSVAGNANIAGVWLTASDYQWLLWRNGASLKFRVTKTKNSASGSEITLGTLVAGAWFSACWSYDPSGGDGASVIRGTLNGVAATPVTNAVAPAAAVAAHLQVGASDGILFAGAVRRFALFPRPLTAAELAAVDATQWGLAADRPAGTVATHARTDSTLCCPFSDAECFTVGPGAPCIHAPSYSGRAGTGGGIEVYGTGVNGLTYSEAFENAAWVKDASVTVADNSAACLSLGPIRMALITVGTANHGLYQYGASTAEKSRAVLLAAATGDADCTIKVADANGTGLETASLTQAPVRYFRYDASGDGLWMYRGGTCARWCAQYAQTTNLAYPVPYRATTGTAYAGSASTATTLTVPVALTDPARWAIGFTGTPTGAWQLSRGAWTLGTYGSAPSVAMYFTTGQAVIRAQGSGDAYWQFTPPATSSDTHTLLTEYVAGAVSLKDNGAPVSLSFAGAPTGSWTMPNTLTVGTVSGQFNGLVSRVAQCRRAGGCR